MRYLGEAAGILLQRPLGVWLREKVGEKMLVKDFELRHQQKLGQAMQDCIVGSVAVAEFLVQNEQSDLVL